MYENNIGDVVIIQNNKAYDNAIETNAITSFDLIVVILIICLCDYFRIVISFIII
jgi:hypothetical protein